MQFILAIGTFISGFLGLYVLTWLVEKFGGRDSPPRLRATRSIAIALGLLAALRMLIMGGDWQFFMLSILIYLPSAAVLWVLHYRRLDRAWDHDEEAEPFR